MAEIFLAGETGLATYNGARPLCQTMAGGSKKPQKICFFSYLARGPTWVDTPSVPALTDDLGCETLARRGRRREVDRPGSLG